MILIKDFTKSDLDKYVLISKILKQAKIKKLQLKISKNCLIYNTTN